MESTLSDKGAIERGSPTVLFRHSPVHDRRWIESRGICDPVQYVTECDEYPFASTEQGGEGNYNAGTVAVDLASYASNQGEGSALTSFYGALNGCNIAPNRGLDSMYVVVPVPVAAYRTSWLCAN